MSDTNVWDGLWLLFPIPFILIGLLVGVGAAVLWRRGNARFYRASISWRRATATIDRAWIEESHGEDTTSYGPRVAYRFRDAGGVERTGDRAFVVLAANWNARAAADAWLARHRPGMTTEVWYDPAQPTDSALTLNKPQRGIYLVFGCTGTVFFAVGLFMQLIFLLVAFG